MHTLQIMGADYEMSFEGGGDAFFSDRHTLWAGHGVRTARKVSKEMPKTDCQYDFKAYERISKLGDFDIVYCELATKRFYHLDTALAPIGSDSALYFPGAFNEDGLKQASFIYQHVYVHCIAILQIKDRLPKAIAVSEEEANKFVCNAITLRDTVILPPGISERNRDAIQNLGYKLAEVDMSEFMKSGGAMQCLCLKA